MGSTDTAPNVLLLGAPGAGKGTQSARLAETYDIDHVTTGDILRANKDMETDYGTPREYMEAGELVPDPVVNEIVEAALQDADGFILDGYPRNVEQATVLDDAADLDVIIHLDVGESELLTRLTGRRVCADCGANYHVEYDPPATAGTCDQCGGELIQRDDDTEETARERLRVFRENTQPVVERYADRPEFIRIDGDRSPDAVWEAVREAVDGALGESAASAK